jgi:endonuclease G
MERLTRDSLRVTDEADRAKSSFKADTESPDAFRVHPSLFLKSGYDKGHLAPARTS